MASPLADLDELVLKCRDQKAKSYIREAVVCYKSGAFRSAIVSSWVAVLFDVVDKLKDLALAGDKIAEDQVSAFEKSIREGDISSSLRFEKNILKFAQSQLELLSPVELIDLERLQEDRNRCAHPSMNVNGDIFNPSAELTRLHIRSAVEHLLQHPPAQGKYALDRLLKQISSEYFPEEVERAIEVLEKSPLVRPRDSLVRNLVVVLIKDMIEPLAQRAEVKRKAVALKAVQALHKIQFELTLSEKLSEILRRVDDENISVIVEFISLLSEYNEFIDQDIFQKIDLYIDRLQDDQLERLEFLYKITRLRESVIRRINKISRREMYKIIMIIPPPELCDRIIDIFSECSNFEQANGFTEVIIRYLADFSREQLERIIRVMGENDQIAYSWQIGNILTGLRGNKKITDDLNELLRLANLERFVKEGEAP